MTDLELETAWTALEPTEPSRRRMQARVFGWLEASDTPLRSEWLSLFAVNPVAATGLLAASAVALLLATPVVWLLGGLI